MQIWFVFQAVGIVIDTLVDCQQLTDKMPKLRWTEPIFDMVIQLMEAAIEFSSQNFVSLISGDMLKRIDKVTDIKFKTSRVKFLENLRLPLCTHGTVFVYFD